jgi:hypothetical protein
MVTVGIGLIAIPGQEFSVTVLAEIGKSRAVVFDGGEALEAACPPCADGNMTTTGAPLNDLIGIAPF